MFHKLIQFIHVDIRKKLRSEIAYRQTLIIKECRLSGCKTLDNLTEQPHSILVDNFFLKSIQQNLMVNRIEKFLHIAFQNKTWSREVSALCPNHLLHSQYAFVNSLINATGKRSGNKTFIKKGVQNLKQCMVQNPIADSRFMNMSNLWITNKKTSIWQMGIFFSKQIAVKFKDVLLKMKFKSLDVFFVTLVFFEFIPRRKQVFQ